MGRTVATIWHASFSTIAAILFFLFTLPRWWELTGFISPTAGTVLRILTGLLIGLTALPVVFTLQRTRKPEFGTPQLALTLLIGSVVAHVLAGTLVVGAAISEIWLSLDTAGPWLFGIYGAAAAIAVLGIGAFYLSFLAELPPPPPKPLKAKKPKQPKQSRRSRRSADAETDADSDDGAEGDETESDESEDGTDAESTSADEDEDEGADQDGDADGDAADEAAAAETVEAPLPGESVTEVIETASTGDDKVTEVIETADSDSAAPRPTGKRRARKNR